MSMYLYFFCFIVFYCLLFSQPKSFLELERMGGLNENKLLLKAAFIDYSICSGEIFSSFFFTSKAWF